MYLLERVKGAVDGSDGLGRPEEVLQVEGTIDWTDWKLRGTQDITSKGSPLVKRPQVIFECPRRSGSKHGRFEILH